MSAPIVSDPIQLEIRDQLVLVAKRLDVIATQLETQNMLQLVAAARDPMLVGTPYMDPELLGLVSTA